MKFAFIVHLRTFEDLIYTLPIPKSFIPFLKLLKPIILPLFWKLKEGKGFLVKSKFHAEEGIEGYILLIWLTGEQIMDGGKAHKVRNRILEAVLYAQNSLGCQIIGLGALTASVTDAGEWLTRQPEVKAAITHGDSYAAAVTIQGIQKLCQQIKLDFSQARVAIVGATGIIGQALAFQLSPILKEKLLLIGRNLKKLKVLQWQAGAGNNPRITTNIKEMQFADIIITATSWPGALLNGEHLKKGVIIYDVSQPQNIHPSVLEKRPDISVIDGAYIAVPPYIEDFWWMSLSIGITFACMAETIMQALEWDLGNHVGQIDPEFLKETLRRAEKHRFRHAPFTSFGKIITFYAKEREVVFSNQRGY